MLGRTSILVIALCAAAIAGVAAATKDSAPEAIRQEMKLFSADVMKAHTRFLSSDLLEGRGPGTRGDQLTQAYIAAQFESFGLEPAGENGSFFQKVSLIGLKLDAGRSRLAFTRDGGNLLGPLVHEEDYVGHDQSQSEAAAVDSEVVFVGHGVDAPEYRWDDYKGLDTRGKTLVMLVNDPPASASEPDLFKGRARTYYGRWTYKFEQGVAKNADAVLLVHTEEAAGYGWPVVRSSWGGENSFVKRKEGQHALKFAGWLSHDAASRLFKAAGQDLEALTRAAASRDFRPVSLGVRLSATTTTIVRPFDTANVVARLRGSDPERAKEGVLYSAHHDHLGIGKPDETGDAVYNGAIDNATGTALLIDMARVWSRTTPRPARSIYFAAVAAEEQGLLGSEYYGQNPSIPAGRIALNLNYDAIGQIGRVSDVTLNGAERTTFFPTASRVARALGLTIVPDQQPEQGRYYRSDHFSFGKVGIPAFSVGAGTTAAGKAADYGRTRAAEYRQKRYHQPGDEMAEDWDWGTGVQMAQFGYWLGWEAANAATMPNWKPGDEFRAIRDRSLARVE